MSQIYRNFAENQRFAYFFLLVFALIQKPLHHAFLKVLFTFFHYTILLQELHKISDKVLRV